MFHCSNAHLLYFLPKAKNMAGWTIIKPQCPLTSEATLPGVVGANHKCHAMALSHSSRSDIAAEFWGHHPEYLPGRKSFRVCVLYARKYDNHKFCRIDAVFPGMTDKE
jgi:hypothetical protein